MLGLTTSTVAVERSTVPGWVPPMVGVLHTRGRAGRGWRRLGKGGCWQGGVGMLCRGSGCCFAVAVVHSRHSRHARTASSGTHQPTYSPARPPTLPTAHCRTHGQGLVVKEAVEERSLACRSPV